MVLQTRRSSLALGQFVPSNPSQVFTSFPVAFSLRGVPTDATRFDMRAAYDALDVRTVKAEVEDLVCELLPLIYSREAIGFTDLTRMTRANAFRPVRQRLVRTHPVTARKSLFLSSHAGAIVGWTIPEARMFLRDLTEHATQREFVYSHDWQLHDLVIWDNRTTVHRARRFDRNEVRDVRRTTLAGDVATIDQAASPCSQRVVPHRAERVGQIALRPCLGKFSGQG